MKGYKKVKETKGVTQGFGVLFTFGGIDLIMRWRSSVLDVLIETQLDIQVDKLIGSWDSEFCVCVCMCGRGGQRERTEWEEAMW